MVSSRLEVERARPVSRLYQPIEQPVPAGSVALGRGARLRAPRESHGAWSVSLDRADPVALLEEQARNRIPELLPSRYGRMVASPFAFYCGAAAIMAADLADAPQSGIHVQLYGDAQVSNFGGFASPNNGLVFDISDFDDTLPGPWEWDIKRLATSIHIAGRIRGCEDEDSQALVLTAVSAYRRAMHEFAALPSPAVLGARLDTDEVARRWGHEVRPTEVRPFGNGVTDVGSRDKVGSTDRMTRWVRGKLVIAGRPPLLVPIEDLYPERARRAVEEAMRGYIWKLKETLQGGARLLLEEFEYAHMARAVAGISGVGLRSWIVLLLGKEHEGLIFLQVKECQASALEPYFGKSGHANPGERVVEGQRLLQAETDDLLGWGRIDDLPGETPRDYYTRRLRDRKLPVEIERIPLRELLAYGQMCGWTLARAHACCGDRIAIANYLGKGPAFDRAIAEFSRSYANQNQRDYYSLRAAVERGTVKAEVGV